MTPQSLRSASQRSQWAMCSSRPVDRSQSSTSSRSHAGRLLTVHRGSGKPMPRSRHWSTVVRLTPARSAMSCVPTGSMPGEDTSGVGVVHTHDCVYNAHRTSDRTFYRPNGLRNPDRQKARAKRTLVGKFKIRRGAPWRACVIENDAGCLIWQGRIDPQGYGRRGGQHPAGVLAHRQVYWDEIGPIPNGLTLDHRCHTEAFRLGQCAGGPTCPHRACVNPAHLEPITSGENVLRGNSIQARNAAKTHCVHGHEFTPENTCFDAEGYRNCRTCRSSSFNGAQSPERRRDSRRRRREAFLAGQKNVVHGRANTYDVYGCRCPQCVQASTDASRLKRLRRRLRKGAV